MGAERLGDQLPRNFPSSGFLSDLDDVAAVDSGLTSNCCCSLVGELGVEEVLGVRGERGEGFLETCSEGRGDVCLEAGSEGRGDVCLETGSDGRTVGCTLMSVGETFSVSLEERWWW